MTASDLEQLLIARLVRERGGTSQTWRRALGKVILRDAIERLLDDVRLEHSIVSAG